MIITIIVYEKIKDIKYQLFIAKDMLSTVLKYIWRQMTVIAFFVLIIFIGYLKIKEKL